MAAKKNVPTSLAAELLHAIHPYGYKNFCASINERDSVSMEFYKASKWVNYFVLDATLTFKNGKINPDHVYEYFGKFNGLSSTAVRKNLLSFISGNIDFVEKRSTVCLPIRNMGFDKWLDTINDGFCCDELALLALSAMYQRHTLVVTKNKFWSTIESAAPLNLLEVMKHCTVRLLYMGNLGFGVLQWKPRDPKPPPACPNLGQFNIVEEYTIDENTGTDFVPNVETTPTMPTSSNAPSVGEHLPKVTSTKMDMIPSLALQAPITKAMILSSSTVETTTTTPVATPKIVYSNDNTDFYVETASNLVKTEALVGSDTEPTPGMYPWKKKLVIRLERLSDFDINLWCKTPYDVGTDGNFLVETLLVKQETDVQMQMAVDAASCGLRTGSKIQRSHVETEPDTKTTSTVSINNTESTSQLIARANKLINRVSAALDVNLDIPSKPAKPYDLAIVPPVNVETTVQPKHTVKCKLCTYSCHSVQGLNKHH